ncbi:hypothetical protein BSK50_30065 [Paenibacillus odorifer]|nr:hypothetical protein BSK50_30065 [Paenibacillus odorifer]
MYSSYYEALPLCPDMSVVGIALYEDGTNVALRWGFRVGHFLIYRFSFDPKRKSQWENSLIYIFNKDDNTIRYDPIGFITYTLYFLEQDMKYLDANYSFKLGYYSREHIEFKLQTFKKYNRL